jgi:hypothetical protein
MSCYAQRRSRAEKHWTGEHTKEYKRCIALLLGVLKSHATCFVEQNINQMNMIIKSLSRV